MSKPDFVREMPESPPVKHITSIKISSEGVYIRVEYPDISLHEEVLTSKGP